MGLEEVIANVIAKQAKEKIKDALRKSLDRTGSELLGLAIINAKTGYSKPILKWDPPSKSTLMHHANRDHPMPHAGLMDIYYDDPVSPSVVSSLKEGNSENIKNFTESDDEMSIKVGTNNKYAAAHEKGDNTIVPVMWKKLEGRKLVRIPVDAILPSRPFLQPALMEFIQKKRFYKILEEELEKT